MVYTGNPCTIEVQRIGKMITANAIIEFTNVTNFGTGQIYINMPVGIPTRAHDLSAGGYLLDGGTTYASDEYTTGDGGDLLLVGDFPDGVKVTYTTKALADDDINSRLIEAVALCFEERMTPPEAIKQSFSHVII